MSSEASLRPLGIDLLFQDEHLLVVSKPSGLASQAGRDGEPGLIEHLQAAGWTSAHLHHRLDQPASGVLAIALSPAADRSLAQQLRDRSASRTYLAVLAAPVDEVVWDRPLDGKSARTRVRPAAPARGYQSVIVTLETGRTHQIRRHAAMAGAPIVGDQRYGAEAGRGWPRLALHAARLGISHPTQGGAMRFAAPLPEDLDALWRLAGGPEDPWA